MKKNERSGEQPREESELQQPTAKIELSGDMEPVIEQALQDMTQEQKRKIAKAAKAWTGENPESDLEGAQILFEEFSKHQAHPKIERAFEQISEQARDTTTQKAQEAISETQEAPAAADSEEKEPAGAFATAADNAVKGIKQILEQLTTLIGSGELEPLRNELRAFTSVLQNYREAFSKAALEEAKENLENWAKSEKAAEELAPYIKQAIEEMGADAVWEDMAIEAGVISGDYGEDGPPRATMFEKIMQRARELKAGASTELIRIASKPADFLRYPLDKPNRYIWNLIAKADADGQLRIDQVFNTMSDKSKKNAGQQPLVYCSLSFVDNDPNIKITKILTQYDKRVYIAVSGLYDAGNLIMTLGQIYKEMGRKGEAGSADKAAIEASLTKMGNARLYLDSTEEALANKNSVAFKWDGPLLPFERLTVIKNGQRTDSAIKPLKDLPLMRFARERKQVTSISRELLAGPLNLTEQNLRLEDYLIEEISHMKNGRSVKGRTRMKLETIYKNCEITGKQRQRTPEKIKKLLTHYKKCGWIYDFSMTDDRKYVDIVPNQPTRKGREAAQGDLQEAET